MLELVTLGSERCLFLVFFLEKCGEPRGIKSEMLNFVFDWEEKGKKQAVCLHCILMKKWLGAA